MDYIKAFVTGGLLCAAVQILMDKTKLMPGRIMVLLVVCGSILGAIGLYEPYAKWAGSGATVPLLGFGNTLWKGVRDGIDKDGVLGLFTGGFIGSNVIVAAGSIITKDVPDNVVVAGIPAKVIGTFDTFLDKRIQETYLQYVDVSPTYYCMVDANAEWEKFYLKRGNLDD